MKNFIHEKMPKVYFGQGILKQILQNELNKVGKNVMLAYGGGSIKRIGLYDEIMTILKENGKMKIGNDRKFLINIISECLPYIGYPRSLNALRCVNEAKKIK